MKKTLWVVLAGLLLFSFTQCSTLKTSKQYKDFTNLLKDTENTIKKAKSCDDLDGAVLRLALGVMAMDEYTGKDKMTDKEETKLMEYTDKVQRMYNNKAAIFGCEEEDDED